MARKPDENPDLKLADDLLFKPQGLQLQRFSHAETVAGRTPDFRVLQATELAAFCEVKSPRDDWLDDQLDSAQSFEIVGGLRNDSTFNRIARHIEKAATQFDAVNGTRVVPNILVFVNHDIASNYGDLIETATGIFHAESGERYVTMPHISEVRISEAKKRIDLYVWIDAPKQLIQGYLFNDAAPEHVSKVCRLLGLDESKIQH